MPSETQEEEMSEEHVTLREFIERIMDEREKSVHNLASSMEHRLSALNELRADVVKDREQYITKAVYDEKHTALYDRLIKVENFQSRMLGVGTMLVILSAVLGSLVAHLLKW